MKLRDIIRRAGRSLRQAKARTLLTSLAIAVGAFTLMLSLAAGEGARQYTENLISSNTDTRELFVSKTSQADWFDTTTPREYTADTGNFQGVSLKRLNQDDIKKVENTPGVGEVTPIYTPQIQYITREGQKKYTGTVEMFGRGSKPEVAAGRLPSEGKLGQGEVILSDKFAKALGFQQPKDAIDQEVTLHIQRPEPTFSLDTSVSPPQPKPQYETKDVTLKIAAVSTQGSNALTAPSPILVSATDAKDMTDFMTKDTDDYGKFMGVTARVKDNANLETVQQALKDEGYQAQSAKDLQGVLFTMVNVLQGITLGFGVLAIIASVFGIINTQYISVLERTQQIGLMKALGMRRRDIGRLFRFEAAWIGFLGGSIGAVLAWAFGTAINPSLSKLVGLGDSHLLVFQWIPSIILVLSLMIVAVIAGILPARKAAKLDPIEALRTE